MSFPQHVDVEGSLLLPAIIHVNGIIHFSSFFTHCIWSLPLGKQLVVAVGSKSRTSSPSGIPVHCWACPTRGQPSSIDVLPDTDHTRHNTYITLLFCFPRLSQHIQLPCRIETQMDRIPSRTVEPLGRGKEWVCLNLFFHNWLQCAVDHSDLLVHLSTGGIVFSWLGVHAATY